MATRWSDLSESNRRLIIAAAIGEAILKTAVLIDLRRRPASQIRGLEADVDHSGSSHQLRRGWAAVVLCFRATAARWRR